MFFLICLSLYLLLIFTYVTKVFFYIYVGGIPFVGILTFDGLTAGTKTGEHIIPLPPTPLLPQPPLFGPDG